MSFLFADSLTAKAADGKTSKLFPAGVTKFREDFPDGKIEFTVEFLSTMIANWKAEGSPERAVNYFHRGATGDYIPNEDKIAAGWITNLELRADGLYAEIRWTERAKEFIQKDELRYLSPEFQLDSVSAVTGKPQGPKLLGAALLNDPFLVELPKVAASERAHVEKELEELKVQLTEAKTVAVKLAEVEKLAAEKISLAEARAVAAEKELEALRLEKRTREVADLCDSLVKTGRITPAMRPGVENLALTHGIDAVKFLSDAPPSVDVSGQAKGVSEGTGDDKSSAQKRFDAKVQELLKNGAKYQTAFQEARRTMPREYTLLFGGK